MSADKMGTRLYRMLPSLRAENEIMKGYLAGESGALLLIMLLMRGHSPT